MDVNFVTLSGNLQSNVEFKRFVDSSGAVAIFTLAANRKYHSPQGRKEETCFVTCVAFGKVAELCAERLSKGSGCFIKGYLRQEHGLTRDERSQNRVRLSIEDIKFLDKKDLKDKEDPGEEKNYNH